MRQLGGSLEISSSDKGTTVTVILPAPGFEAGMAHENVAWGFQQAIRSLADGPSVPDASPKEDSP
jgi:hypothetical protein